MVGKVIGAVAGVAGLLVLGSVSATAAASPSPSPSPSWHIIKSVHSGVTGNFTAVVATGKTTAWAFNGGPGNTEIPTAWVRSGSTWTRMSFPGKTNEVVIAAGATSRSDVWAFTDVGFGGRVLHWNGHKWSVRVMFAKPIGGAAVLASNDIWVFGQPNIIEQLGVWHYNGHVWSRVSKYLDGGSALSAADVWAFSGTKVAHWNGHAWASTSVKKLLPAKQFLNDPALTGIYARSRSDVYAIGNGNRQDEGGPTVILHYNGRKFSKVAEGSFGYGTLPSQQVSPDGHGGLWLPMPGLLGAPSFIVHYTAGHLTTAKLPVSGRLITVDSVAHVPGTARALAGGFTHAKNNLGSHVVAVILQYS